MLRWWRALEDDFPAADEPDAVRFAVEHAGTVVGMIQYAEENEPDYRHAGIDVFLDPAVHGRGLGLDAILALAVHLVRDRGHHRSDASTPRPPTRRRSPATRRRASAPSA